MLKHKLDCRSLCTIWKQGMYIYIYKRFEPIQFNPLYSWGQGVLFSNNKLFALQETLGKWLCRHRTVPGTDKKVVTVERQASKLGSSVGSFLHNVRYKLLVLQAQSEVCVGPAMYRGCALLLTWVSPKRLHRKSTDLQEQKKAWRIAFKQFKFDNQNVQLLMNIFWCWRMSIGFRQTTWTFSELALIVFWSCLFRLVFQQPCRPCSFNCRKLCERVLPQNICHNPWPQQDDVNSWPPTFGHEDDVNSCLPNPDRPKMMLITDHWPPASDHSKLIAREKLPRKLLSKAAEENFSRTWNCQC